MNSLDRLSGVREVTVKERLKPPKPPDIDSKYSVELMWHPRKSGASGPYF
jgi:hypothetical protein